LRRGNEEDWLFDIVRFESPGGFARAASSVSVIVPSPLAGEGCSMLPQAMMGEGCCYKKPLTHSSAREDHCALSRKGRGRNGAAAHFGETNPRKSARLIRAKNQPVGAENNG
jgi:hypothetical protein